MSPHVCSSFAAGVASTGTSLLLPLQSEIEGRGEHERQRLYLAAGIRASAGVGVLLGFPLVILPAWVLTAWLGSGFESSVVPLALLGAAATFTTTNAVLSQYLFAHGRAAMLAIAQSLLAAANLGLTIALLIAHRRYLGGRARHARRREHLCDSRAPSGRDDCGVPMGCCTRAWLAPVLVGLVAALPTLVLARVVTDTDSLLVLAAVGAAWAALFGAVAWRVALTPGER